MRQIFILLLFITSLFAQYEKISIGKIDDYYYEKVTFTQLENLIKEIEQTFETQLGFNVFDYSLDGKPIDLFYLPPSKLEQKIEKKISSFDKKAKKLEDYKEYFIIKKRELDSLQEQYNLKSKNLNDKIKELNSYIEEANKKKYTKREYDEVKAYINQKKEAINYDSKEKKKLERELQKVVLQYNNKIILFNTTVNQAKMLSNEIESLSRNNKIVKGKTFGNKEITLKTYYKDGKKFEEKEIRNSMNKIEIYNFDNLNQLKAVLAHEIAHLVGIPHIESTGSLMNPILQQNQIDELFLTSDDIKNFRENF